MKKKHLLLLIFFGLLIYPGFWGFRVFFLFPIAETSGAIKTDITQFQLSLWLSWLGMAFLAIYYKWTEKDNLFFKLTYFFLILGFGTFGYFTQKAVNLFESSSRFSDSYTLGVFTALQHLAVGVVFTIFLQIAVRIFQTKWHRD